MKKFKSDWIGRNRYLQPVPSTSGDDIGPRYEWRERPLITCLCGSTRFWKEYMEVDFKLTTDENRIVLSVGFYPRITQTTVLQDGCMGPQEARVNIVDMTQTGNSAEHLGITADKKIELDDLHKRKIDLADEIFVVNVGGYVGDSTKSEIDYANKMGKTIRWLEPDKAWQPLPVVDSKPDNSGTKA